MAQTLRTRKRGNAERRPPTRVTPFCERFDERLEGAVAAARFDQFAAEGVVAGAAKRKALAFGLAKEERANGIHVNVVAPGLVETEMGRRLIKATQGVDDISTIHSRMPFGRVCQPEDVANVVRYLVSERGSYLTGEKLNVHGGG